MCKKKETRKNKDGTEANINKNLNNEQPSETICLSETCPVESLNDVTSLMSIYLTDWMHRDDLFWKQAFAYFTAIIALSAFPFVDIWEKNLPKKFPQFIFPIVGLALSVLFLVVMKAYMERLKSIQNAYFSLMDRLPKEYSYRLDQEDEEEGTQSETQTGNKTPFYKNRMAELITWVMFAGMLLVGAVSLFVSLIVYCR